MSPQRKVNSIERKLSVVENKIEHTKLKKVIDRVLGDKRHYKYCPCCREYDET